MRLADAFEIVLDLAGWGVIEDPSNDAEQEQKAKQIAAIAKVEEFLCTHGFDNSKHPDAGEHLCDYCNHSGIEIKAVDQATGKVACSNCKYKANKAPIYARVDFGSSEGPRFVFVQLETVDLDSDYNGQAAVLREMRKAGKNTNSIIGWSFYSRAELESDPAFASIVAIFDEHEHDDAPTDGFDGYGHGD